MTKTKTANVGVTKSVNIAVTTYERIIDKCNKKNLPIGETVTVLLDEALDKEDNGEQLTTRKEKEEEPVYPLNPRERRLKAIGKLLLGTDTINLKDLERLIEMQKVEDRRVINDYKKVLEVKGWIIRMSPTKYATAQDVISEDLNIL